MSLDCSEIQEMFGRIRVQAALKPFFSSVLLLLPGKLTKLQVTIAKYHQTLPGTFVPESSNLTAPSSSRLIMNFDTSKTTLTEFPCINVYPFSFTIRK